MMRYEKRLIILTGEGDAKATIKAERTSYGLTLDVCCYRLGAAAGHYILAIRQDDLVEQFDLGSAAGNADGLSISPQFDLSCAHFIIYVSGPDRALPVMYGSLNRQRLWKGNWRDGIEIRKTPHEIISKPAASDLSAEVFSYSPRKSCFEDFLPKKLDSYQDDAIAEVNYYAGTPIERAALTLEQARTEPADGSRTPAGVQSEYVEGYLDALNRSNEGASLKAAAAAAKEKLTLAADMQMGYLDQYLKTADPQKGSAAQAYDLPGQKIPPDRTPQQNPHSDDSRLPQDFRPDEGDTRLPRPPAFNGSPLGPAPHDDDSRLPQDFQPDDHDTLPISPPAFGGSDVPQRPVFERNSALPPQNPLSGSADTPSEAVRPVYRRRRGLLYDGQVPADPEGELRTARPVMTASDDVLVPPAVDRDAGKKVSARKLSFYEQVQDQLNQLFEKYPHETLLESLLPFTKWVRVDYEQDGRYYVVGIIGEKPDYICYGIPATFTPAPPAALDGYCQWLPRDAARPEGEGFWLLYQDATSGESVEEIR